MRDGQPARRLRAEDVLGRPDPPAPDLPRGGGDARGHRRLLARLHVVPAREPRRRGRPLPRGRLRGGRARSSPQWAGARCPHQAPHADRLHPGHRRRVPRRHRGQRRAAGDPRRPRHRPRRAAVGRRGLPADARRAAAGRRLARRRARPQADLLGRAGGLRRHVAAVRARADRRAADRRAGAAGHRRRAARALLARDHHRRLPRRRARRGDRDVDGVGRDRDGGRAARRRAAGRPRLVALDLRDQRAVRARDAGDPALGGAGVARRGVRCTGSTTSARCSSRSGSPGRCSR